MDAGAAFRRDVFTGTQPAWVYQAQHSLIQQFGGTLGKDLGAAVLKAEAVYTRGRKVETVSAGASDGLVAQNMVDWIMGLEFALPREGRLNLQAFQRVYLNHDPGITADRRENGVSVYLYGKFSDQLDAQLLVIAGLNRSDWLVRPRIGWNFQRNWRATFGADMFRGSPAGMFGRYSGHDRAYGEVRYSF